MLFFYIFIISFIIISSMVSLKVFEQKVGRKTIFSKKISNFDKVILRLYKYIKSIIENIFIKIKSFILKKLISYLRSFFGSVKGHIDEKYIELNSNLRGKKIIKNKGSVSFYLRDISEYKSNNFRNTK